MSEPLLSLTQAAAQFGYPRIQLWRAVRAQAIRVTRFGRKYFVRASDVEVWIQRHTVAAQATTPAPSRRQAYAAHETEAAHA